jgi:arabinogalactan endo-1,4-beta-galactosidase
MDKKAIFGFCGLILAAVIIITGMLLDMGKEPGTAPGTAPGTVSGTEPGPKPDKGVQITVEDVSPKGKIEGSSLYVKQVSYLPEDFIMGMDVSSLLAQEASGVKYYDFDGNEQDLLKILAQNGINYIRVRVWNDPFDENGNGYGGGNCTIDTALEIGKRATKYGMKLLVDFHYSDFWADPGKQMVPKAWQGMTIDQKEEAVYQYTKESLQKLKDAGVAVGMVQVGNETNGHICGESSQDHMCRIFSAGSRAIREVLPEAKVALHFTNPENFEQFGEYAVMLDKKKVDYDVFASSYYPFWHGTLENLQHELSHIKLVYDKEVLVVETSYAYTAEDTDFSGNTISAGSWVDKPYPYTVQGQADSVRDVIDTVNKTHGGLGVVYWEGAWISVGQNSWEENHEKWEKYGSGWASSYAAGYDPKDAGKYYGGCAVDNQAMFGPDGRPLESLRIFNLVRYGNEVPVEIVSVQDVDVSILAGETFDLPQTVKAVMNDGSVADVPVKWTVDDSVNTGEPGKYEIPGEAEGFSVTAFITVTPGGGNVLLNGSFENGDLMGWTLTEYGKADELGVLNKPSDSMDGEHCFHFWGEKKDSVHFRLEQTIPQLEGGKYNFRISMMGGDAGDCEAFAYLIIDGNLFWQSDMSLTGYGQWQEAFIGFDHGDDVSEVTVGIYVCCSGEGNGAWGSIDAAELIKLP